MPQVTSEEEFKDALNHHTKTIVADINEMQKQYKDMRIDPVLRFISISVPTACTSLTDYMPIEYKGIVLGAGVILGVAQVLHDRIKEKNEQKVQPLSYLQTLDSQMNAPSIIARLRNAYQSVK